MPVPFASLAFLAAAASAAPTSSTPFTKGLSAFGTEPFWNLTIDPSSFLMFQNGDMAPVDVPYAAPVIGTDGSATFKSGALSIALRADPTCSDGMSDLVYPYGATVTVTGGEQAGTYKGCAYELWTNHLLELLPQIDICLKEAKSRGAVLIAARSEGMTTVRIGKEDTIFQCTIPDGAAKPEKAGLVNDSIPLLAEGNPMFFRAPGKNPGGECFDAPEVHDDKGNLIGWTMVNEDC